MTALFSPRAPRRSRTAFEQIYSEQYEPMVQLACGLVDRRAVAEEIVQDSFRQLWQRWDTISQPCRYLRTTVVNGCHNELRRRRVRREHWHELTSSASLRALGDADYLADALADVNERRRRALVLRFYGDCSIDEIAQAMDIPTGTAKSLIHRGLADLRVAINC